ncbi:hypothetical protein PCE1_004095 [Barthelona sp. PCE]
MTLPDKWLGDSKELRLDLPSDLQFDGYLGCNSSFVYKNHRERREQVIEWRTTITCKDCEYVEPFTQRVFEVRDPFYDTQFWKPRFAFIKCLIPLTTKFSLAIAMLYEDEKMGLYLIEFAEPGGESIRTKIRDIPAGARFIISDGLYLEASISERILYDFRDFSQNLTTCLFRYVTTPYEKVCKVANTQHWFFYNLNYSENGENNTFTSCVICNPLNDDRIEISEHIPALLTHEFDMRGWPGMDIRRLSDFAYIHYFKDDEVIFSIRIMNFITVFVKVRDNGEIRERVHKFIFLKDEPFCFEKQFPDFKSDNLNIELNNITVYDGFLSHEAILVPE